KERNSLQHKVGVIMGRKSDWETMQHESDILDEIQVPYEKKVVSSHRTQDLMFTYAEEAVERRLYVFIAGTCVSMQLPGLVASKKLLTVIGVPIQSRALNGMDSLLSIVQMPGGVPVATMAIGKAGATNSGLYAAQLLGVNDEALMKRIAKRREEMKQISLESSSELI